MCLRKRKIKSPIKEQNRLSISKINIDIPCGRCRQCRKTRTNDWLVRSYFEFISKPQDAFFVTLDFDEWNVPLYNTFTHAPADSEDRKLYMSRAWDYENQPEHLLTVFDHEIVQRFLDSLRNGLDVPFRYMIASDSGSFMSRPHYHGVFLFDQGSMDEITFHNKVEYYWHYGSHSNIKSISKRYKNPFKALEYVCSYSVKDVDFDKLRKRESLPGRFSPRVLPSIGWGAQCMDPLEFSSDRLMKQGVMFLDKPVITKKYLTENSLVYISLGNDNRLVPFTIPRYYELKLMYNWRWNSTTKREEATLNSDGIELAKLRLNRCFEYYYSSFLLSKLEPITSDSQVMDTFRMYYPKSPYCNMLWKDIVKDVELDLDSFFEYCKFRPYLEYTMPYYDRYGHLVRPSEGIGRYRPLRFTSRFWNPSYKSQEDHGYYFSASLSDNLKDWYTFFDEDDIQRYIEATFLFDCYTYITNDRKCHYYDWKDKEELKEKCRQKVADDPSLYFHLKHHRFNFSKLNPTIYVPQQSNVSY